MKIAEAVAAYGAGLSTFVAYRQWRVTRPKIVITAMPAFNGEGFEPVGKFVRVVVANRGGSDIHIRQAFIRILMDWATWRGRIAGFIFRRGDWRSGEHLAVPMPAPTIFNPALPATLAPGQSCIIWIDHDTYEQLQDGPHAKGMQVAVQDETDRTFASPPLRRFGSPALPSSIER